MKLPRGPESCFESRKGCLTPDRIGNPEASVVIVLPTFGSDGDTMNSWSIYLQMSRRSLLL